jgi:hypothetical protein
MIPGRLVLTVAALAILGGDPLLDIRNPRDAKPVMRGGRRSQYRIS